MNPASFSVLTVLRTCSTHGLKQQMRVVRSFWRLSQIPAHSKHWLGNILVALSWHGRRRPTEPAGQGTLKDEPVTVSDVQEKGYVPASAASVTVKPSLQTFRCVRVTISSIPCCVNSSLHGRRSVMEILERFISRRTLL